MAADNIYGLKCRKPPQDLKGKVFGRLLVMRFLYSKRTYNWRYMWLCLCVCGSYSIVLGNSLTTGNTKSCGCLHREIATKIIKKYTKKGADCWNWKGGIAPLRELIRGSHKSQEWKFAVYERDGRKCRMCGRKQNKHNPLHAHHIIRFSTIMDQYSIKTVEQAHNCEALWDITNGITLCKSCHEHVHYSESGTT